MPLTGGTGKLRARAGRQGQRDTIASWTPSHAVLKALSRKQHKRSGSLATAGAEAVTAGWTGWTGHKDRQLALNRLDVMHRRLLDSYPPSSPHVQVQVRAQARPAQAHSSRSYDFLGTPIPTSQLNSKTPARHGPVCGVCTVPHLASQWSRLFNARWQLALASAGGPQACLSYLELRFNGRAKQGMGNG